jgi:hypothetical protein
MAGSTNAVSEPGGAALGHKTVSVARLAFTAIVIGAAAA